MRLVDASKNAECFGIQTHRQSPTLAFLYFLLQTYNEHALVISGFEKKYLKKMTTTKNIQGISSLISVINLRATWKDEKQNLGYSFIHKELELIISKSDKPIIILHSIGDFFEFQDANEVESFVDMLIQTCNKAGKKLIYTIDIDQPLSSIITEAFHNHIDLEVAIKNDDIHKASIEVLYSIESVKYNHYLFSMPKAGSFVFEPYIADTTTKSTEIAHNSKPRVVLTSDNENSLKRVAYFFDKQIFDVEIVESSMPSILAKLMSNPQLLIYISSESFHDATRYELCTSAKEQELETSIVYITGSSFIRNSDKRLAGASHCGDLFEENFNIEAFVTSIEKILVKPFYSDMLKSLEIPKTILKLEEFSQYRDICLKKHIFFTQLTYRYKAKDPSIKLLESIVSRTGDVVSLVKSEHTIMLLLLNTSINQTSIFNEKMKKIDSNIVFLEAFECVSFYE